MSYMKPSAPDAETSRRSCPYPLTSGHFPEPYSEYHTLLSRGQGGDATRLNNGVAPIETTSTYSTANRRMPPPFPTDFQNSDVRMNFGPTIHPPPYDQTLAPNYANTPRTVAAGIRLETNPNSREIGPSFPTRTTIVRENVHSPNKKTKKACQVCLLIFLIIIVLIATGVLRALILAQQRDKIVHALKD